MQAVIPTTSHPPLSPLRLAAVQSLWKSLWEDGEPEYMAIVVFDEHEPNADELLAEVPNRWGDTGECWVAPTKIGCTYAVAAERDRLREWLGSAAIEYPFMPVLSLENAAWIVRAVHLDFLRSN